MRMRETTSTERRSFGLPVSSIVRVNLPVALAAVVLFAAAAPNPALAQSTVTTRTQDNAFSITVNNPCNGDPQIGINGHETVQIQTQDTPGAFHLKIQEHQQGNGTGTTGIQYQYQLMNSLFAFDSSTSTFSLTVSSKNHIIGNTKGDNFFSTTFDKAIVKNGQPTVTIDHFTTSCK